MTAPHESGSRVTQCLLQTCSVPPVTLLHTQARPALDRTDRAGPGPGSPEPPVRAGPAPAWGSAPHLGPPTPPSWKSHLKAEGLGGAPPALLPGPAGGTPCSPETAPSLLGAALDTVNVLRLGFKASSATCSAREHGPPCLGAPPVPGNGWAGGPGSWDAPVPEPGRQCPEHAATGPLPTPEAGPGPEHPPQRPPGMRLAVGFPACVPGARGDSAGWGWGRNPQGPCCVLP